MGASWNKCSFPQDCVDRTQMVAKDANLKPEGYRAVSDSMDDPNRWKQTFTPRTMSRIDNSLPSLRDHVATEPDPIFDARRRDSPRHIPLSARSHSPWDNAHLAYKSPRSLSHVGGPVYEREGTRNEMCLSARDHVIVSSARLRHQTTGEASIDEDENEDVLVQKALDVVAERMSKRETFSTPRTPRLGTSNLTRFVDFPKTEFSTRKAGANGDGAMSQDGKRSPSLSSFTSDGESGSYDEEFSPMSETGVIAFMSNDKDERLVKKSKDVDTSNREMISMEEALLLIYSISLDEMVKRGAAAPPLDLLRMRLNRDDWLRHFKIAGVDQYLSANMSDICSREDNASEWVVEKQPGSQEAKISKKIDFQEDNEHVHRQQQHVSQQDDIARRQVEKMQDSRKTETMAKTSLSQHNDLVSNARQDRSQRQVPSLRIENILQDERLQIFQREKLAQQQDEVARSSQDLKAKATSMQQIISKTDRWVQDMQILSERGLLPETKSPRFRNLTPRSSRSVLPDGVTIKAEVISPARAN
mmetsp:Transcript_6993/g.24438  ORF Transcript_6993/g.24438 Transcript_6993/m.24438 type:complete len:530 (-) Transcript_6993:38-1627(-)